MFDAKFKKGFTLIELLVVVAIIAVLVSVLLPALAQARGMARSAVCLSNLKTAGNAFYMYAQDNNGYLPPAAQKYAWRRWDWSESISEYCDMVGRFGSDHSRCPSAQPEDCSKIFPGESYEFTLTYGAHIRATSWPDNMDSTHWAFPISGAINLCSKLDNVNVFLISDGTYFGEVRSPHTWGLPTAANTVGFWQHNEKANFLFPDGHVETIGYGAFMGNEGSIW